MNSRRTRKGGAIYKLDVTESTSYDTNMYEIAGVIHLKVDDFKFINDQSYINQYLKKDIIEKTLKKYSNASRIIGYNVKNIQREYSICSEYETQLIRDYYNNGPSNFFKNKKREPRYKQVRKKVCSCNTVCPGAYIISGIVLQPIKKEVSAGTRRLTKTGPASGSALRVSSAHAKTRSRSKSKSN